MVKINCAYCGLEIDKELNQIVTSKDNTVYCDKECQSAARKTGQIMKCAKCQKKVYLPPSRVKAKKPGLFFCSKVCSGKSKKSTICAGCGTTFFLIPSKLKHSVDHYCSKTCQINSEIWRSKIAEISKERWKDSDRRERANAALKKLWNDSERLNRASIQAKIRWEKPGYREKLSADSKERCASPEWFAHRSQLSKAMWEDPEHQAKMEAIQKSPEFKNKWRAAIDSPETRAKQSIAAAKRKPTWHSRGELIVDEILTRWDYNYVPQKFIGSPEDYSEGYFGCRVDHYLELPNGIQVAIECNGKFHHADHRLYPDPAKWTKTQKEVVAHYQRKKRLLQHLNIMLVELWELDNDLAEDIIIGSLLLLSESK